MQQAPRGATWFVADDEAAKELANFGGSGRWLV